MAEGLEKKIEQEKIPEHFLLDRKATPEELEEIKQALEFAKAVDYSVSDEKTPSFVIYDKFIHGSDPNPISNQLKPVDYDEIFSHLGELRAKNIYEGNNDGGISPAVAQQAVEHMILTEEDHKKYVQWQKMLVSGPVMGAGSGLVPPPGYDSKKWEAKKLAIQLDRVMEKLMYTLN